MKKSLICLFLVLALLLTPMTSALAAEAEPADPEFYAAALKALGLFRGTGNGDFELERPMTRAEALVLLLRLTGEEAAALAGTNDHPFADIAVCRWAEPYIAYAYAHGLVTGISASAFGGNQTVDGRSFLTLVLRALGYRDGAEGDFVWSSPYALAGKTGVLPTQANVTDFCRSDAVLVCYAALGVRCRDSVETLGETLVQRGTLAPETLKTYYDADALRNGMDWTVASAVEDLIRNERLPLGIDITGLEIRTHGSLCRIGDAAYEMYGFYPQGAERCAAQIRAAAEALAGKARVFGIVVPNRMGACLSYADFSRLSSSTRNETSAIEYAYEKMGSSVITVDAMSRLRLRNEEYIYFRTDHHWTALGSYYAYTAWAQAAGFAPVQRSNFDTLTMTGHLGAFYEMCDKPSVMKKNPDTVTAYIPRSSLTVEYHDYKETYEGPLIYDCSAYSNKYGTFLGGDHPLVTITNNDIQDDSACVLVKDSYGNPFVAWLTQHYHTVYMIDYRYYKSLPDYCTFTRFADEKGVQDFIVLLPMTLSQSDTTANYLANYCK